jgi:ABC-type amino acid transport substrate-binding protein
MVADLRADVSQIPDVKDNPSLLLLLPLAIRRDGEADKEAMVEDLRAGMYDALVLDAPVLEYSVGTNEECDLFTGRQWRH